MFINKILHALLDIYSCWLIELIKCIPSFISIKCILTYNFTIPVNFTNRIITWIRVYSLAFFKFHHSHQLHKYLSLSSRPTRTPSTLNIGWRYSKPTSEAKGALVSFPNGLIFQRSPPHLLQPIPNTIPPPQSYLPPPSISHKPFTSVLVPTMRSGRLHLIWNARRRKSRCHKPARHCRGRILRGWDRVWDWLEEVGRRDLNLKVMGLNIKKCHKLLPVQISEGKSTFEPMKGEFDLSSGTPPGR